MSLICLKLFTGYSLPVGIRSNLSDMAYQTIHYLAEPVSFVKPYLQRHWNSNHAKVFKNYDFEDAVLSFWKALLPSSLCTQYSWHIWSIAGRPLRQEQSKQGEEY